MLSETEKLAWIRLYRTSTIGPKNFKKLCSHYGSASEAIQHLSALAQAGGARQNPIPPSLYQIKIEYEATLAFGANYIFHSDESYPSYLKEIPDAPPFLIYKGNLEILKQKQIAMVGSRNASYIGKKMTALLSATGGKMGWSIVSGLARGIDTAAHKAALNTGTIAVIAGGIDNIYPPENKDLYQDLFQKGLVLTEAPIGSLPQARHFPKRNRIISALSSITLILEATLRSGSLITANYALEQGKEIWAIPGSPMDPRAAGGNELIKKGAMMIQDEEDFKAQLLHFSATPNRAPQNFIPSQMDFNLEESTDFFEGDLTMHPTSAPMDKNILRTKIQKTLSLIPISLDELIRECETSSKEVQMILLELELANRLERHPGNKIALTAL